jgi:hypothetical protein
MNTAYDGQERARPSGRNGNRLPLRKRGERVGGRQKGTPNKMSAEFKEALMAAAAELGGGRRVSKTGGLLNVEMDYLAGLFALVAWAWLLRLEAGEQAEATMFENARDAGFGDAELSCDVLLGAALTAQSLDVICGEGDLAWQRRGFEERSRKPSTPSARKRMTHLPTVFGVVWYSRAVAALVSPPATTARTIASRPLGVRQAFLWMSIRSSANRYVWQHQLSRPGPNGQPPESSQLARSSSLRSPSSPRRKTRDPGTLAVSLRPSAIGRCCLAAMRSRRARSDLTVSSMGAIVTCKVTIPKQVCHSDNRGIGCST